jgi:hypothetical protein
MGKVEYQKAKKNPEWIGPTVVYHEASDENDREICAEKDK